MSKAKTNRSEWQCPVCDRTFRLPAGGPRPRMCRECTVECEQAAAEESAVSLAKSGPLDDMPTTGASRSRPAKRRTATRPDPPFAARSHEPSQPPSPSKLDEYVDRKDHDQVLEYLANISRSMTFFRRLVWGMILMMLLNVVVMGIGVMYAIKQISSLEGLLDIPANVQIQPPAAGGGDGRPGAQPGLQGMEQLGEYARQLQEATDQALGQ